MYQQRVLNPNLKGYKGTLVVLAAIAAAFIGNAFFNWLQRYIGRAASACFILYGCCVAWYFMRVVGAYDYVTDGSILRIFRAYGKRQRFIADVRLDAAQGYGSPEDMRKKFPGARLDKAVKRQCKLEPFAIAYRDGDRQAILIIQPDEQMREVLIKGLKKK